MEIPVIDDKKFEEFKKKNAQERLDFVRKYAEWLRKTPNKEWSKQQKNVVDQK